MDIKKEKIMNSLFNKNAEQQNIKIYYYKQLHTLVLMFMSKNLNIIYLYKNHKI